MEISIELSGKVIHPTGELKEIVSLPKQKGVLHFRYRSDEEVLKAAIEAEEIGLIVMPHYFENSEHPHQLDIALPANALLVITDYE